MTSESEIKRTTHFEKTVEWLYVRDHLSKNFGAPLAGLHEKAGDALVSDGTKLILIEFKRSPAELGSEKDKYPATRDEDQEEDIHQKLQEHAEFRKLFLNIYQQRKLLASRVNTSNQRSEAPHAFVFGCYGITSIDSREITALNSLVARHYWGKWANNHWYYDESSGPTHQSPKKAAEELADVDIDIKDLVESIGWEGEDFKNYVNQLIEAKGGAKGAAKGDWMYASVMGLVPMGDKVGTVMMSLWEYAHATGMDDLCGAFTSFDLELAKLKVSEHSTPQEVGDSDVRTSIDVSGQKKNGEPRLTPRPRRPTGPRPP